MKKMGNWEFHILKFPAQSINVDKQGTTSKTIWQPKKKCERERDIIVVYQRSAPLRESFWSDDDRNSS